MPAEPKSLAWIAESSGFLMADVAFLSGLEESTVSRLWDDPHWLDRVRGKSLQSLVSSRNEITYPLGGIVKPVTCDDVNRSGFVISFQILSVIPGLGEYILEFSLAERRSRLVEGLSRVDLEVNQVAFRRLVQERRVPEQYLSNALDTAVSILDGDAGKAAAHLARFWGRDQDFALGFLFSNTDTDGLLNDVSPLIRASIDMIARLDARKYSFHAIIAQANLMHHVVRAAPDYVGISSPSDLSRRSALAFRSTVIGRIMVTDDQELAERYCRDVAASSLLAIVEGWAFPTYTHDARVTPDFSLPRSLLLCHTAEEVLREIDHYNDAYLFYLAETSIPMIIRRDSTFGLRLPKLIHTLKARLETCQQPAARSACEALLHELETNRSVGQKESLNYAW